MINNYVFVSVFVVINGVARSLLDTPKSPEPEIEMKMQPQIEETPTIGKLFNIYKNVTQIIKVSI